MESIGIGALVVVAILIVGGFVPVARGRIAASRAAKRDPLPDLEADRVYRRYLDAEVHMAEHGKTQMRILLWGLLVVAAMALFGVVFMTLRSFVARVPGATMNEENMLWLQWGIFAFAAVIAFAVVYAAAAWPIWVEAQQYFYRKSLTPAEFDAARARFEAPVLAVANKRPWWSRRSSAARGRR